MHDKSIRWAEDNRVLEERTLVELAQLEDDKARMLDRLATEAASCGADRELLRSTIERWAEHGPLDWCRSWRLGR